MKKEVKELLKSLMILFGYLMSAIGFIIAIIMLVKEMI